jgi:hypothetical protein
MGEGRCHTLLSTHPRNRKGEGIHLTLVGDIGLKGGLVERLVERLVEHIQRAATWTVREVRVASIHCRVSKSKHHTLVVWPSHRGAWRAVEAAAGRRAVLLDCVGDGDRGCRPMLADGRDEPRGARA